jgi:hypothetical protein
LLAQLIGEDERRQGWMDGEKTNGQLRSIYNTRGRGYAYDYGQKLDDFSKELTIGASSMEF